MTAYAARQLVKAVVVSAAGLSLVVGWVLIEIGKAVSLPAGRVR